MVRIEFGNETDLQAALATVGPVAVTIDGCSKAFRVSSYSLFLFRVSSYSHSLSLSQNNTLFLVFHLSLSLFFTKRWSHVLTVLHSLFIHYSPSCCGQFYAQGVFDWSGCSSTKLNHPLLLIGYGYTQVDSIYTEYWLLKNRLQPCKMATV